MKLILVLQHLLLFIPVLPLTRAQTTTETTLTETTTAESAATSTDPSSETTAFTSTSTVPPVYNASNTTVTPATTTLSTTVPPATTTFTTVPPVVAMTSAQPWTAPAIFYPFGSAVGDTEQAVNNDEGLYFVSLSTPFTFFGHTYTMLYLMHTGLLTFTLTSGATSGPNYTPIRGNDDFIAALWSDIDDYYTIGLFSYQQYTNGSVLDRATQDINQYFFTTNFSASWVFVATWRYNLQPNPAILFQVVLISGGDWSFFLMNYGDCAVLYETMEAGYNTMNSVSNFVIPDSINGNYRSLKNTTNVNVPGRWAFISNKGLENIIGTQFKLTSYLDLTQSNNLEAVLQQIKQELVSRGLSGNFEIKKRRVKKVQP